VPVQYSYTSTPPMGRTTCTEPQCLYSTTIPLLPLWAVLLVQSLSACTVQLYFHSPLWTVLPVHSLSACTVQLYFHSPLWAVLPLHRLSAFTVQLYFQSPLWAVLPVQSLSACTVQLYFHSPYGPYCLYRASEPVVYSSTYTLPMGRTTCKKPQCL